MWQGFGDLCHQIFCPLHAGFALGNHHSWDSCPPSISSQESLEQGYGSWISHHQPSFTRISTIIDHHQPLRGRCRGLGAIPRGDDQSLHHVSASCLPVSVAIEVVQYFHFSLNLQTYHINNLLNQLGSKNATGWHRVKIPGAVDRTWIHGSSLGFRVGAFVTHMGREEKSSRALAPSWPRLES